jgi:hypothetical protein
MFFFSLVLTVFKLKKDKATRYKLSPRKIHKAALIPNNTSSPNESSIENTDNDPNAILWPGLKAIFRNLNKKSGMARNITANKK